MDAASWGTFVEVCPNKPTPKTKKKACKNQALTSIRSWDDSSSEEEPHHKRRGRKHSSSSSSHVCLMARGNKSSSSSESDSDDDMPSYHEIVQQNLKYAKVCTSQQKKLKNLNEKLGSSQEAYKNFSYLPVCSVGRNLGSPGRGPRGSAACNHRKRRGAIGWKV